MQCQKIIATPLHLPSFGDITSYNRYSAITNKIMLPCFSLPLWCLGCTCQHLLVILMSSLLCVVSEMHYASTLFASIIKHSSIVAQESCSSCINVARIFLEECSAGHKNTSLVAADGIKSSASKYQHVNLLVTSGSLIPSLVKCLLFRLDNMITDENG